MCFVWNWRGIFFFCCGYFKGHSLSYHHMLLYLLLSSFNLHNNFCCISICIGIYSWIVVSVRSQYKNPFQRISEFNWFFVCLENKWFWKFAIDFLPIKIIFIGKKNNKKDVYSIENGFVILLYTYPQQPNDFVWPVERCK